MVVTATAFPWVHAAETEVGSPASLVEYFHSYCWTENMMGSVPSWKQQPEAVHRAGVYITVLVCKP